LKKKNDFKKIFLIGIGLIKICVWLELEPKKKHIKGV
jgi:hypothetical protein